MKKLIYVLLHLSIFWLPTVAIAQEHCLYQALALRPYFELSATGNKAVLKESTTFDKESSDQSGPKKKLLQEVRRIFAPYCGGLDLVDKEHVNEVFNNGNPFMTIEYNAKFGLKKDKLAALALPEVAPPSGNPVNSIADGIARFLVKRTKDELTLAFFDEFKRKVEEDPLYFKHFFGNTKQMLQVIDTEVFQFQIYLEALREAFISDLRVLPGNLGIYLRENPLQQIKPSNQAIGIDLFQVVQMTMEGAPALHLIRYLADDTLSEIQTKAVSDPALKDLSTALILAHHISESLYNPDIGRWYSAAEIKAVLLDPVTVRIYMGLLWHHAKKIIPEFKNGVKIEALLAKAATDAALLNKLWEHLSIFGEIAEALEKNLQSRTDNSISLSENFSSCLQQITRLLQTANSLNAILNPGTNDPIELKYLQLLQQIGALHFNARQKHYSAAIGNTVFILDALLGKDFSGKKDLLKYGMFIAAIAESESAAEVQNALQLFALPPGSSKAKKGAGRFSIAANAYTGFNGGVERFSRSNISEGVVSVAAPLGISANWGYTTRGAKKKDGSIGIFFPVIDVGAILAYRFKEDGVENLPPLEWKNLVAPGAYLVANPPLGRWPLTLGIGGQMGPLLRKVEQNGTLKNVDVGAYRLGGFITLDIPVNYLKLSGGR